MVTVSRPADWTETADWLGIHYMAAIRAAKNLAVEYQRAAIWQSSWPARSAITTASSLPRRWSPRRLPSTRTPGTPSSCTLSASTTRASHGYCPITIAPRTPSTSASPPSRKDAPRRANSPHTTRFFTQLIFVRNSISPPRQSRTNGVAEHCEHILLTLQSSM
jgi:hypothetical protein